MTPVHNQDSAEHSARLVWGTSLAATASRVLNDLFYIQDSVVELAGSDCEHSTDRSLDWARYLCGSALMTLVQINLANLQGKITQEQVLYLFRGLAIEVEEQIGASPGLRTVLSAYYSLADTARRLAVTATSRKEG